MAESFENSPWAQQSNSVERDVPVHDKECRVEMMIDADCCRYLMSRLLLR